MSERPTDIQIRIAAALGIRIEEDSRRIAAARIADVVAEAIGERHGPRSATPRQVQFAESLRLDIQDDTVRVASAKIADELDRRNRERLVALQIQPGDQVRLRKVGLGAPHLVGGYDRLEQRGNAGAVEQRPDRIRTGVAERHQRMAAFTECAEAGTGVVPWFEGPHCLEDGRHHVERVDRERPWPVSMKLPPASRNGT